VKISSTYEAKYNTGNDDNDILGKYPVLKQFSDVFPEEMHGLPPHREVDFSIEPT